MKKQPKARTRHTQYTTEAFLELLDTAREELLEHNGTLEIKDLRTWNAELVRFLGRVSDRQDGDTVDRNPMFGAGAE